MSATAQRAPAAARRILIAEDEPAANLLLTRLLQKQGFEVTTLGDGAQAIARLERETFDAALLDWMLPSLDGIEVARRVRALPAPRPRVIMMSVLDIPVARAHATDAGAIDFLAKPVSPARLAQALAGLGQDAAAPPASPAAAQAHPVARTSAWKDLPVTIAKAIGDMIQEPVGIEDGRAVGDDHLIAVCPMTDATHGLELWTAVSAPLEDAKAVASGLLGEPSPSPADAQEILAELTNVVGGVLKSKFAPDGFTFALSVPTVVRPGELRSAHEGALATCPVGVRVGRARVTLRLCVKASGAIDVKVEQLREGHVLAEDLRSAAGGMLLPACTCLTDTTVRRLRANIPGATVKVCAPSRASSV